MNSSVILKKYPPRMEYLLQILHDIQNHNPQNYLPAQDLVTVANHLNVTTGSIYGVAGYYSMFSLTPRGQHIIRVCRSPVCHMDRSLDMIKEIETALGIQPGATTVDGRFTLETAECLGHCEVAPVMLIDETAYGHLTTSKIARTLEIYLIPDDPSEVTDLDEYQSTLMGSSLHKRDSKEG